MLTRAASLRSTVGWTAYYSCVDVRWRCDALPCRLDHRCRPGRTEAETRETGPATHGGVDEGWDARPRPAAVAWRQAPGTLRTRRRALPDRSVLANEASQLAMVNAGRRSAQALALARTVTQITGDLTGRSGVRRKRPAASSACQRHGVRQSAIARRDVVCASQVIDGCGAVAACGGITVATLTVGPLAGTGRPSRRADDSSAKTGRPLTRSL